MSRAGSYALLERRRGDTLHLRASRHHASGKYANITTTHIFIMKVFAKSECLRNRSVRTSNRCGRVGGVREHDIGAGHPRQTESWPRPLVSGRVSYRCPSRFARRAFSDRETKHKKCASQFKPGDSDFTERTDNHDNAGLGFYERSLLITSTSAPGVKSTEGLASARRHQMIVFYCCSAAPMNGIDVLSPSVLFFV